jgi:hypothetical protein
LSPHEPAVQNCPAAQSLSPAQTATHPVWVALLHTNGKQDWVVAGLHVPAPSQERTSVSTVEPAGQEAGAHWVPAAYSWQAPAPLQNPVVPQLPAP